MSDDFYNHFPPYSLKQGFSLNMELKYLTAKAGKPAPKILHSYLPRIIVHSPLNMSLRTLKWGLCASVVNTSKWAIVWTYGRKSLSVQGKAQGHFSLGCPVWFPPLPSGFSAHVTMVPGGLEAPDRLLWNEVGSLKTPSHSSVTDIDGQTRSLYESVHRGGTCISLLYQWQLSVCVGQAPPWLLDNDVALSSLVLDSSVLGSWTLHLRTKTLMNRNKQANRCGGFRWWQSNALRSETGRGIDRLSRLGYMGI